MADEINSQFTDVFNKNEHSQVPFPNRLAHLMNDIVVSAEGITKLLNGLNQSMALGPDELHPRVLKELASGWGLVFVHLFHQSIDTGEIPKEWSLTSSDTQAHIKLLIVSVPDHCLLIYFTVANTPI